MKSSDSGVPIIQLFVIRKNFVQNKFMCLVVRRPFLNMSNQIVSYSFSDKVVGVPDERMGEELCACIK